MKKGFEENEKNKFVENYFKEESIDQRMLENVKEILSRKEFLHTRSSLLGNDLFCDQKKIERES
jgi:hypothetical protein